MGYRGKLQEQARARALRADGETLDDIASALGVSKGSVSRWVQGVDFEPRPRKKARRRAPNALQQRKAAEVDRLLAAGRDLIGTLSEREFLVAGAALYAGEGSKTDRELRFTNTDPRLVAFYCAWLRKFVRPDESRLRVRLYLHEGLDVTAATAFWSSMTGIPTNQFTKPYRAAADPTRRHSKHEHGCVGVDYRSASAHRTVMGLVSALLTSTAYSGVAQLAERLTVNQ
jgi:transcriptional regulator with XRE-family HTH domain